MSAIFRKTVFVCFLIPIVSFSFIIQSFAGNKEADLQVIFNEMKSPDASVREDAVWKLSTVLGWDYLDTKKDEIVPHLIKLLKDENKRVRWKAAINLHLIDRDHKREEVVRVFAEEIRENSSMMVLSILGSYGPKAKSAVPAIIEAMKKRQDTISSAILWEGQCVLALEKIGAPEALEAIKPYKRKIEYRRKLVRPIAIISGSRIGSSLLILGLLGLFVWGRIQRKKGYKLIGWPLFIPMLDWLRCVYKPVEYNPVFDFHQQLAWLTVTLIGIIPWLLSLLWYWRKKRAMS